jgi:hypothetical protein
LKNEGLQNFFFFFFSYFILHTFQHFLYRYRIGRVAAQERLMRLHKTQNRCRMTAQFFANLREGIPLFVQTSRNNTTAIGEERRTHTGTQTTTAHGRGTTQEVREAGIIYQHNKLIFERSTEIGERQKYKKVEVSASEQSDAAYR